MSEFEKVERQVINITINIFNLDRLNDMDCIMRIFPRPRLHSQRARLIFYNQRYGPDTVKQRRANRDATTTAEDKGNYFPPLHLIELNWRDCVGSFLRVQ